MTNSKIRRVSGAQNRTSGELRERSRVVLGGLWAGSGRSRGDQGWAPEKFRGRCFVLFPGRKKYEHLSKKSFPSSSAETAAEYFIRQLFTVIFPFRPGRTRLVGI